LFCTRKKYEDQNKKYELEIETLKNQLQIVKKQMSYNVIFVNSSISPSFFPLSSSFVLKDINMRLFSDNSNTSREEILKQVYELICWNDEKEIKLSPKQSFSIFFEHFLPIIKYLLSPLTVFLFYYFFFLCFYYLIFLLFYYFIIF
jgi:hypothetical protein